MSLQAIRSTLHAYVPATLKTADLKAALSVIIDAEPQPCDQECLEILKEDIQVEILFHSEIISGPNVLFRVLRDYLVLKGVPYLRHPNTNKLSYGVANTFLDDEDKVYAFDQLKSLRNNSEKYKQEPDEKCHVPQPVIVTQSSNHEDKDRKTAYSMAQHFKNKSDRFSGKLGEDVHEHFRNYELASNDYKLSPEQKLAYLHNLFEGEAKQYYHSTAFSKANSYNEAKENIIRFFDTRTRQVRVRQYLQSLTLSSIMEKRSCDVSDGLEYLRNIISKFAPQGPHAHRGQEAKVEYLYNAVLGNQWASTALTNCYAQAEPWSFTQLSQALDSAWLQEQQKNKQTKIIEPTQHNDTTEILWETQRYYGNPRGKRSQISRTFRSTHRKKGVPRCWNCNEQGHMSYRCPQKSRNMTSNVNSAIRRNPKKANRILFELCQQYDAEQSESSDNSSSDEEDSDHDEDDTVNDANFVECLDLANEESASNSEDF